MYDEIAKELFGTTSDCNEAGFILKDGSLLNLKGSSKMAGRDTHDIISMIFSGKRNAVKEFMRETGAIRLHHSTNTDFLEIWAEHKPTNRQLATIRKCACYQGLDPHRIVYDIINDKGIVISDAVFSQWREVSCDIIVNRFQHEIDMLFNEMNTNHD